MSQPKLKLYYYYISECHYIDMENEATFTHSLDTIAKAKTKKTAYKRAATKLRKLADEAERLAEES